MADLKISALTTSTTPLAGTEVLPIVQSGTTKQVSVANLTAGRTVGTGALNTTGKITVNLDGALGLRLNNTTGGAGQGIEMLTATTKYSFLLGAQYNVNNGFEITPSTAVGGTTFSTPAFKVEDVGSSVFNVTVGTGNLVIGTSGKGIDFSATPGTGTSEVFADYEEGTWTPTDQSGAGLTFAAAAGTYTKIGRMVYLQANITYPVTANTNQVGWGTFPFTAANGNHVNAIAWSDGAFSALEFAASTTILNAYFTSATGSAILTNAQASGKNFRINIFYSV
jgi:hypothetical protein